MSGRIIFCLAENHIFDSNSASSRALLCRAVKIDQRGFQRKHVELFICCLPGTLAVHCCCFPSSLTKWVRPRVTVGNPRALTAQTPWRWMCSCSIALNALTVTMREPSAMCSSTHRFCIGARWRRCKPGYTTAFA